MSAPSGLGCHTCFSPSVYELAEYATLLRVTSDCKPWPTGGRLCVCETCGTVQKKIDDCWRAEIAEIYANYTIYFQADGTEQAVFNANSGQALLRSDRLVEQLLQHAALPAHGRLLDIGCGNGAFLSAFSSAIAGWTLVGTELYDKNRAVIEAIPWVEALYTGTLAEVPGRFAVVSLIHALEHIPHPLDLLRTARDKMQPDGLLFIEVPNAARNPFDLLVADHASHFTPRSLEGLLERAGFEIVTSSTEWVAKEISVVARHRNCTPRPAAAGADGPAVAGLDWLLDVRAAARAARENARPRPFGLFGSSIAATWLAQELGGATEFFVDEDPNRRGSRFMDHPILAPCDVPTGAHVFIGVGGGLAQRIAERLTRLFPEVSWQPAPALHERC